MQTKYSNRLYWSLVYLSKAGALKKVRRGTYAITDRGRELLQSKPQKVTVKVLAQFPEFQEFHKKGTTDIRDGDSSQTPEERLESSFKELQASLASDVLDAVKKSSARFFENLVVELLVAMGYGGSIADAGSVVGKSGDEGIDGVIKEDKLGLDVVYIQAKKWTGNAVGRPVVQSFAGSLEGHRARKGVMITTSSFSQEAREYVKRIEKKIVLIDGAELAQLMIEHDVGVSAAKSFTVKKLDQDFFETE